ncbi:MAG: hypothetical protein FWC49_03715, partial [Proteobacteria bacterium]|nr:hypothetical protein [Pseudomonadota bacterium]
MVRGFFFRGGAKRPFPDQCGGSFGAVNDAGVPISQGKTALSQSREHLSQHGVPSVAMSGM